MEHQGPRFRVFSASILLLGVLLSCEPQVVVEVGLIWRDDAHFHRDLKAYVALLDGEWDTQTGFDGDLRASEEVVPGRNTTIQFEITDRGASSCTAFLFFDENEDLQYDEGYDTVVGYKYNSCPSGEVLRICLSGHY